MELLKLNLEFIVFTALNNPLTVFILAVVLLLVRYVPVLRDLLVAAGFSVLIGFLIHFLINSFWDVDDGFFLIFYLYYGAISFVILGLVCVSVGSKNYNDWRRYKKIVKVYNEEVNGAKNMKNIIKVIEEDKEIKTVY